MSAKKTGQKITPKEKNIIGQWYEEESMMAKERDKLAFFNVGMQTHDAALIAILAERFSKSTEQVAEHGLALGMKALFAALNQEDRKQLAKLADEYDQKLVLEISEEKGFEINDRSSVWTTYDRVLTRQETKAREAQAKRVEAEQTEAEKTEVDQAAADGDVKSKSNAAKSNKKTSISVTDAVAASASPQPDAAEQNEIVNSDEEQEGALFA